MPQRFYTTTTNRTSRMKTVISANIRRKRGLHISTYENLHRKRYVAVFGKKTRNGSGRMSKKISLYATDELELLLESRTLEAQKLQPEISTSELITAHFKHASKYPIIEVIQ